MGKKNPLPILITGGGRRIGLAVAWHFINQKQPVIVSYLDGVCVSDHRLGRRVTPVGDMSEAA